MPTVENVYQAQNNLPKAIADYNKAIEIDPKVPVFMRIVEMSINLKAICHKLLMITAKH